MRWGGPNSRGNFSSYLIGGRSHSDASGFIYDDSAGREGGKGDKEENRSGRIA